MLKAEIVIRALDKDGQVFDFSHYTYSNIEGQTVPDKDFEDYIREYANRIALFACSESWDECDFIAVVGINFEKIEDD